MSPSLEAVVQTTVITLKFDKCHAAGVLSHLSNIKTIENFNIQSCSLETLQDLMIRGPTAERIKHCSGGVEVFSWKLYHWVRCHLQTQLRIKLMTTAYKIALVRMPQNFFDDKLTLVQVMPCYCQATSHYLIQCLPKSMSKYGITRPQWFNSFKTLHASSSQVRALERLL